MRVYVGEVSSDGFHLWLVEQRRTVSVDEITAVLRELDECSALSPARDSALDESARRTTRDHKNDVLARMRAAQEAPPPRLLLERSEPLVAISVDVATAVLASELGVKPTPLVPTVRVGPRPRRCFGQPVHPRKPGAQLAARAARPRRA